MDTTTLEKLNYIEIKELIKQYCISGLGKELINKVTPYNNIKIIKRKLEETSECRKLLDASYNIPLEGIHNITYLIEKIEKGGVLEGSELIIISDFLRGCRKVKRFFQGKEGYAETLSLYALNISEIQCIEEEINYSISGNRVNSNASKELKKIRKAMDLCEGKIKEKLEKFLRNPLNKDALQENFISNRNGRYTLPIKASFKNKVEGTIVEVSSKGNTVFVEPNLISKYSIELITLQGEESIEEYKILATITEMINSYLKEIKINTEVIGELDMILAKAKYSKASNGIAPIINKNGYTKIINGKFPLIKNSIPLNIEIGKNYRALIITGPNAGGKTVVLKTLGLLTLMVQSGFHISCNEGSEIAIYDNIFVDIGDNQSIENSLSTFSSHVKNLSQIIKKSNNKTLLLFDEIGSGTEPNEGAALAIAILEELYKKGSIILATTHYGEIKDYSYNHPDFENAAMEFENETLEPLYKLIIGKSGKSNALYISEKMGISKEIVTKAKMYYEKKDYNFDTIDFKVNEEKKEYNIEDNIQYNKGDKVLLLDNNKSAIVFEGVDELNNLVVFLNKKFIKVNKKRLKLEIKACNLYPEGYDLNEIFIEFKERKLKKDIERGSKKALKNIRKEHLT